MPVELPGRRPPLPAHQADAAWAARARWPRRLTLAVGPVGSPHCLPLSWAVCAAATSGVAVAWRRARELGRLLMPAAGPGGTRYRARHAAIAWRRQPAARPRPRPGRDLAGMAHLGRGSQVPSQSGCAVTGMGLSGARFPLVTKGPGYDGLLRASPGAVGMAERRWLGGQVPLRAAVNLRRPFDALVRIFRIIPCNCFPNWSAG